jgi:hypothetical protein
MIQKMNVRNLVIMCVVTLLATSVGLGALPPRTVRAQVSAFLATPY